MRFGYSYEVSFPRDSRHSKSKMGLSLSLYAGDECSVTTVKKFDFHKEILKM